MNILHMKYAVEIAKCGSINKASELLRVAQPNLSRSIKDLENDLNITIFERSSRGITLTPQGEEFIGYAKKILTQIDDVEALYTQSHKQRQRFSISVPRGSYISEAFACFTNKLSSEPAELFYHETNALHVVKNITESNYNLGILRYADQYDHYFKQMIAEKGLRSELITEFKYVLLMHRDNKLAQLPEVCRHDLNNYIEIAHADPFVPSVPFSTVKQTELSEDIKRRIFVFERGSQFDLLYQNHETFMWVSPVPDHICARYELVQRECIDNTRVYRDVLIYPKDYKLSKLDKDFITELCESKRKYIH